MNSAERFTDRFERATTVPALFTMLASTSSIRRYSIGSIFRFSVPLAVSVNVHAAGTPDPTAVPCALIVTALPAIVPVWLPLKGLIPPAPRLSSWLLAEQNLL